MTPILRNSIVVSMLVVGTLSACAPNPYVLQDKVYGTLPVSPSPAVPASPAPDTTAASSKAAEKKPATATSGKQDTSPPPEISDTPQEDAEVLVVPASKTYKSSPAVQALVKQADAEITKGNFDGAAATIERALRIESDNPDLWLKLSVINERQGRHEQAASMANKAKFYREQLN